MTPNSDAAATALFSPIKMERVADKIAAQLKKAIADGKLRVGDRLPPERDLAEQMGVSRPSVREAIQQLELIGLLESVQGGGTVVKSLTEKEFQTPMEILLAEDKQKVIELTEVRGGMESWAARQAARNRTEDELARIQVCLEEMERDLKRGRIRAEVDVKFHTEIVAASHNTIFLHMMQSIYNLIIYSIRLYRERVFLTRQDQETLYHHHQEVFKAIQDRDPDAAEAAMGEHLRFVIKEYKSRFMSPST
jgi:GntR family transcriptional repressor for pyruvate dehydrogenase complex